ncbi:MAG: hemolysin family protein [Lachnospiraceae bacterium]|jgi:putative hemolysin|nr:hemolysin family protein [Lachnospiraceae bacterium]
MGEDGPSASYFLLFITVVIDMFFYGFGAAISQLNAKEVLRKSVEDKDKKSARLSRLINHPNDYKNTLQLAVTLNHLGAGIFFFSVGQKNIHTFLTWITGFSQQADPLLQHILQVVAAVVSIAVLLYIVLTFGILLPAKIASRNPTKVAYLWITPATIAVCILSPFTRLVNASLLLIMRIFGAKKITDTGDVTEEIINMVNEGHEQGLIQASEAEMITNIFDFADKEAQDIMTPRSQVTAVDGNMTLREAVAFILQEKNSRFPVYLTNVDFVVGILHLRDAVHAMRKQEDTTRSITSIEGLLREPYFVPQTKHIDELFSELQRNKLQMAIVVDEYGQMDGLVAMEDILEEIVGNIMDEYDEDVEYIEEKGKDEYVVEGMSPLVELEDCLGITFEEEEFDTLNGFLISRMDKIPEENEQFEMDAYGYHFQVLSVENKRIQRVRITRNT